MATVFTTFGRDRSNSVPRGGHLDFRVVSCSSSTQQFPPHNLSTLGSTGWISDEFPSYPVDILIELAGSDAVESVQLTALQYFIPSVIDISSIDDGDFVSGVDMPGMNVQPLAQFRFTDEDENGWPTDSLVKEIRFSPPVMTRYLQLSCHRPLPDPYNQFDQVGIGSLFIEGPNTEDSMALIPSQTNIHHPNRYSVVPTRRTRNFYLPNFRPRVFREPAYAPQYGRTRKSRGPFYFPPTLSQMFRSRRPDFAPPPKPRHREITVAQLLVRLENYKQSAIRGEDFETAGETKAVIEGLNKIEETIRDIDAKKEDAVQEEDYQKAEDCKFAVYEQTVFALKYLRSKRFGHFFEKEQLKELEDALRRRRLRPVRNITPTKPASPTAPSISRIHRDRTEVRSETGFTSTVSEVDRPIQPAPVADDDAEHRPSPIHTAIPQVETSGEKMRRQRTEPKGYETSRGNTTTTKKGGKARTDLPPGFQYAVEVFGEETVEEILSAAFLSRLHGLERINEITDAAVESRPSRYPIMWLIRGSVVVLEEMLKEDAVIMQLTAHVLLKLLRDIVPRYSDARADVPLIFNMALPFALSRLGNTSRRISQILMPFVVELATMDLAKENSTVMNIIFEELKPTAQVRYCVGRLRIVQDLIFLVPVNDSNTGMTLELVVSFVLSAMEHNDREVRRGGEKILIWLYDKPPPLTFKPNLPSSAKKVLYRDTIRQVLPRDVLPEGDKAKRDFRYRGLFRVLAQIDLGDRPNVPPAEPRLRSPALAPEHVAFYSKWYRLNRGTLEEDESEMDGVESRSQIRVVLSRNSRSRSYHSEYDHEKSRSPEPTEPVLGPMRANTPNRELDSQKTFSIQSIVERKIEKIEQKDDHDKEETKGQLKMPTEESGVSVASTAEVTKEVIPLRKDRKYWKNLRLLGAVLESEGYELVGKDGLAKDKKRWPKHVVQSCPFCGKPNVVNDMNYHLYQECPMLKKCGLCDNKILVPELTKHQLESCEHKSQMTMCPHCELAIPLMKITKHLKADECVDPSEETNATVCPLCEGLVENSDEGWIFHLLDKEHGCEKNPRRKKALKWAAQKPNAEVVSMEKFSETVVVIRK